MTEVDTPTTLVQLRLLRRLAETNGLLTDSERSQIEELEKKWSTLLEGGYVGSPRRKVGF
jgi:hypothetical protein